MTSTFLIILGLVLIIIVTGYFLFKPGKRKGPDTLYADALALIIEGNNSEAIKLLKNVVKTDTEHINAYLHLGNLLRETNNSQAIKIHQTLIVRPKLSKFLQLKIYQALARDYFAAKDMKRALREADQVLSIEKNNLWALNFKLKVLEIQENWDGAGDVAKQIQKVTGSKDNTILARYLVEKGKAMIALNDRKGADSAFRKAIKMSPEYPDSYLHIGNVFEFEKKLSKAVDYWEAYAERSGSDGSAIYEKIESALYEMGRFSEIEEFYSKLIEFSPGNMEVRIRLASVLEAKGETKLALSAVEEALDQDGEYIPAQLMKIRLEVENLPANKIINKMDKLIEKISSKS